MSQATTFEDLKAKAEVYYGDEICREKFRHLLTEIGFPDGLVITLQEIEEYGHVRDTGFVWLKHKKKNKEEKKKNEFFKFDNIFIWHDTEVTAYFEPNKIKNLTGVKAKDFLIWITLSEIYVNGDHGAASPSSMITFRTPAGLSKSFPSSVFELGNTPLMVHKEIAEAKEGDSSKIEM
ncbi:hypothetical protein HS088_TW13G01684 [Tripterygium wilfordii]|uniref:Uncharacterized protein n=1 Tax=Tripterygium wilfordii TaxID=458696 RepID=A0A7J7CXH6_TRIWF|nr:uncharacterized protein LOC120011726 [Tripterygium wilfordii]KAF5738783.1 hypothetical protein HS088_TW13G01684 [Tripterygium wilfordii]